MEDIQTHREGRSVTNSISHVRSAVGTVRKGDRLLTTIDEWHRFAPPKRRIHWKTWRSAKENARAWIAAKPGIQPDIAQVLANCPDVGPVRRWSAEPEARIAIDSFPGEQPNIDLLLVAEDDHGSVVVAIEAKADECFGKLLADQYQDARAAPALNPRSNAVARIEALLERFDVETHQRPMPRLRYQLFTATAAVLAEAERRSSDRAVLIAHEFVTPLTDPGKRERNAADLHRFLAVALDYYPAHLDPGDITGPIPVKAAPTLYVGKARTVIPQAAFASNPCP